MLENVINMGTFQLLYTISLAYKVLFYFRSNSIVRSHSNMEIEEDCLKAPRTTSYLNRPADHGPT